MKGTSPYPGPSDRTNALNSARYSSAESGEAHLDVDERVANAVDERVRETG
jgi:hypothetical protein